MSEPTTDEMLTFLSNWKTREQICDKFEMSNTSSFRYLRWLEKGKYIVKERLAIVGHKNKCYFYKSK